MARNCRASCAGLPSKGSARSDCWKKVKRGVQSAYTKYSGYSTIKQGSILIAPIALILIIIAVVQATVPVPSAAQPPAAAAGSPHAPSETASTGLSANGLVSTLGAGAAQLLSPQRIPALQTVVETVMLTYVEGLEARKACFPDTSAPAAYAAVLAEQGVIYSLGVVAGQYIVPGITNTTVHASMLVMTSSAIAAMDAAVLKAMIENKATKAQALSTAKVVTGCIFALGLILLSSLVQLGHDWLLDAIMKIRLAAKVFSGVTKFKRKPTTPPPQADAAPLNPVQENPASPSGSPITSQEMSHRSNPKKTGALQLTNKGAEGEDALSDVF